MEGFTLSLTFDKFTPPVACVVRSCVSGAESCFVQGSISTGVYILSVYNVAGSKLYFQKETSLSFPEYAACNTVFSSTLHRYHQIVL